MTDGVRYWPMRYFLTALSQVILRTVSSSSWPIVFLDDLLGVGPDAVWVGVVGTPDEIVNADVVGHVADAGVLLEGGRALTIPVFAGLQVEGRVELLVHEAVVVLDVHALDDERNPAGATFAEDELEVREALARAAHDDADEPFGAGKLAQGRAGGLEGELVLGGGVGEVGVGEVSLVLRRLDLDAAAPADVEGDGHLGLGGGFPEGVPVAVADVDGLEDAADVEVGAAEAEGGDAAEFFAGDDGVVDGDASEGVPAAGALVAEVGDPVVVDTEGGFDDFRDP